MASVLHLRWARGRISKKTRRLVTYFKSVVKSQTGGGVGVNRKVRKIILTDSIDCPITSLSKPGV